MYKRSARLGPSLALMLAAPALNPAALILTLMLFDYKNATTRAAASLVAVMFIGMIADKVISEVRVPLKIDGVAPEFSVRSHLLRFHPFVLSNSPTTHSGDSYWRLGLYDHRAVASREFPSG